MDIPMSFDLTFITIMILNDIINDITFDIKIFNVTPIVTFSSKFDTKYHQKMMKIYTSKIKKSRKMLTFCKVFWG